MTKDRLLEIIEEENLIQFNILNDHADQAHEVIIKREENDFIIYQTDENKNILGNKEIFSNESEAFDKYVTILRKLKENYLEVYIGNKYQDYFREKFAHKNNKKWFISWIWPPFFVGYGWLLYRKLYIETIIVFSFLIISGTILTVFNLGDILRDIYGCIKILIALMGNCLYYAKTNRVMKKLKNIDSADHAQYLEKHGGTNIIPAIVVELLLLGMAFLPELVK